MISHLRLMEIYVLTLNNSAIEQYPGMSHTAGRGLYTKQNFVSFKRALTLSTADSTHREQPNSFPRGQQFFDAAANLAGIWTHHQLSFERPDSNTVWVIINVATTLATSSRTSRIQYP